MSGDTGAAGAAGGKPGAQLESLRAALEGRTNPTQTVTHDVIAHQAAGLRCEQRHHDEVPVEAAAAA